MPGINIGSKGKCNVCLEYESNRKKYDSFFKTEDELAALLRKSPATQSGRYDCLLLYSGGKDSTYALFRLAGMGVRVLAMTFDNGFLSPLSLDNIGKVCNYLKVKSVIAGMPEDRMNAVFVESLRSTGTVCYGCGRAFTARGAELAIQNGIPTVVTGLSRGQIFELKLHQLLQSGVQIEEVEDYLRMVRKYYHSDHPIISGLICDTAMKNEEAFEKLAFVDFYRYCGVTKSEITGFLAENAPFWRKPEDSGACSSNCTLNDVGIYLNIREKGYHNYAVPVSWEIRFGHISREEGLAEIDTGHIEEKKVTDALCRLGYREGIDAGQESFLQSFMEIGEDF